MNLTRRDFLLATSGIFLSTRVQVSARKRKKVLVLGAGLSGLSAAYELSLKGFDVTVLEARNRVGGRISTLREPFSDNQFAELGGELVGGDYQRFASYAKKFELPIENIPEQFETGGAVAALQGGTGTTAILKNTLYQIGSVFSPHPYGLTGDEAKGLPPVILSRTLRGMVRETANNPQKLVEFDKISLAGALRARGVSAEAVRLINFTLNYNSIETVSAGGVLFDTQRRMKAGTNAFRIVGGNDFVPKALYENGQKSGVKYIFEAEVKKIRQKKNSVEVVFQDKTGKNETLKADKIVCTIPFSVLRDVEFSPALPDAKSKAIHEISYTRVTKTFLQGSRVEWDARNLGSSIWTDTPLERIFENAGKRGSERGIFTVWTDGEGAIFPEKMSDAERQTWAKTEFEKILPFMKNQIERTATKSWTNDKFARGAFAHFTVGKFAELKPHVKTPVGNIHFAGEHTAEYFPGMEGALESAERVVAEISR